MNIKPTLCERLLRAASLAVLLGGIAACAAAPRERPLSTAPIQGGPGTLAEARKYLEGRWTLESFEVRPPGKKPISLKGTGVLNYDDFGNLRMEIRTDEATSDLLRAAGIGIVNGVIATDGRTVLDLQNRTSPMSSRASPHRWLQVAARSRRIGRVTGRSPPTCSR